MYYVELKNRESGGEILKNFSRFNFILPEKKLVMVFSLSANYNICVLQVHLENCSKIPLSCPNSCGKLIPREMVHALHFSLSEVIDGRVVVYIAGMATVWVPASKVLSNVSVCFQKLKAISLINRQQKD